MDHTTQETQPLAPPPQPTPGFSTSGDVAPLFAALAKAQGEFGEIHRTATVTIQPREGRAYSFSYAPLEDVLAAVRPALSKNGLWLGQPLSSANGKYTLRTILAHSSGGALMMVVDLQAGADIKALGSSITYLRRYTVQALLGLAAEEDDDGSAANGDGYERKPRADKPKPEPAPKDGTTATDGDLQTMLGAIAKSPSAEHLKTLIEAGKVRPWSSVQRTALNKAFTERTAWLKSPENDGRAQGSAA